MRNISELYSEFMQSSGVTTDSRNVKAGQMYFALRGEHFDGNSFASDAIASGARLAVVDDPRLKGQRACFYVDDTLLELQELASHHRDQLGIPIIALTGSNGKTTTKELIANVLSDSFEVGYTRGNLNNHVGVPLTLLSFNSQTQIGVVEMGANHPGEIERLTAIAQPNIGLITNIGKAHLEGFESLDGVFSCKTEMLKYLISHEGVFFINVDDDRLSSLIDIPRSITYGASRVARFRAEMISSSPLLSLRCWDGEQFIGEIATQLAGAYNLHNVIAAIAVGRYLNIEASDIIERVHNYKPSNNRSQIVSTSSNQIVLDAYNANPSSIESALASFDPIIADKKVVILGDMFELGSSSHMEHLRIIRLIKDYGFEEVYLVGPRFSEALGEIDFTAFHSTELACEYFRKHKLEKRYILLKGSRGMHLEDLLPLF